MKWYKSKTFKLINIILTIVAGLYIAIFYNRVENILIIFLGINFFMEGVKNLVAYRCEILEKEIEELDKSIKTNEK